MEGGGVEEEGQHGNCLEKQCRFGALTSFRIMIGTFVLYDELFA